MAVPQVGPGKGREEPLDYGRARETGDKCDLFAFRTPPLRNVALTGPWMHNGAYTTLEGAVRHMLDPVRGYQEYDPSQLPLEMRELVIDDPEIEAQLTAGCDRVEPVVLEEAEIQALLAFMHALSSPSAADLSHLIPSSVPSGLPPGGP